MREYFCGWYFKSQSEKQTLAIIPAIHKSKKQQSCSVQLITNEGAWNIDLPYEYFYKHKKAFIIKIKNNLFGRKGIKLCLNANNFSAVGSLRFGNFSPIKYDIMGPFKYVPFMECRHSVVSMKHAVNGNLCINGVNYRFKNAVGYIEGDRGYSFPKEYAWTHCFFKDGSIMLSVADIPFGLFHFTGIIGVIKWKGKEYRMATYLGAIATRIEDGEIVIKQRNTYLSVKLIEKQSHPLRAPISGSMNRTIHESASCLASYRFQRNGHTLFSFKSDRASFEYEFSK